MFSKLNQTQQRLGAIISSESVVLTREMDITIIVFENNGCCVSDD